MTINSVLANDTRKKKKVEYETISDKTFQHETLL